MWRMRAKGKRDALEGGVDVTHARRREGIPVEEGGAVYLTHACQEMGVGRLSGADCCLSACASEGG